MWARVSTGVTAGIAFSLAIFLPFPGLFISVVALLLVFAAREWSRLSQFNALARLVFIFLLLILYSALIWVGRQNTAPLLLLTCLAMLFWLLIIPLLCLYNRFSSWFSNAWFVGFLGSIFLLSTATGLVWLKSLEQGEWRVVLLVGLVAAADTFAFLAGRKFGKNKLASEISPAKTREGAYGGLLANSLLALIIIWAFDFSGFSNFLVLALIIGASILSIVGDLLESAIKRNSGVKDSGDMLPGHGGILDRIDGLLAATPYFVLGTLLFSPLS